MQSYSSMLRFLMASIAITCFTIFAHAQVGIGTTTPNSAAALELQFTNKGFLMTRVSLSSTTDNTTIPSPATALLVYNTNAGISGGAGTGFYFNAGTSGAPNWTRLQSNAGSGNPWLITGNSGTNPATDFIGTITNAPLTFRTNNIQSGRLDPIFRSYFLGENAGINNAGISNVGLGHNALRNNTVRGGLVAVGDSVLYSNGTGAFSSTHGAFNTGVGSRALRKNTIGSNNTALGSRALLENTVGTDNTAAGADALRNNISGNFNSALGSNALEVNNGSNNTAMGNGALQDNTTASNNTAVGANALGNNITGTRNTAAGSGSLFNSTRNDNTAVGNAAGQSITTGERNTAIGVEVLERPSASSSNDNVAIGYRALRAGGNTNVAVGSRALELTTGESNVGIGYLTGSTLVGGDNNTAVGSNITFNANITNSTAIGYGITITSNNTVRIGNNTVTSIGGQVAWTSLSDQRAKSNIQNNVPGLDFVLKLKPVSYELHESFEAAKAASNSTKTSGNSSRHIGFLAQEVAQVAKNINFDFDGIDIPAAPEDAYGIRYGLFVVPLIKAVQEQQAEIDSLLQKARELKIELEQAVQAATKASNSTNPINQ